MAERRIGQLSFADDLVAERPNVTLERIASLVDWSRVEALLHGLRSGSRGAPAYPSLVLFKALLLQQWYGLSDPGLEETVADRLSFRRFLGLSLSEPVPDHSTLWRFREQLGKSGLAEHAFASIVGQIERSGFVLKRGTLIDASLIRSAVNAPEPPAAPPTLDGEDRPASKLVGSPHDPEAAWTKKEGRYFFGYKMHVGMDADSRIVRRLAFTPANINESVAADALICGDEAIVYADKAYDSHARRKLLRTKHIMNGIMRRGHPRRPLTAYAIRRNKRLAKHRGTIEAIFSLYKNVHKLARARYRGLARNATTAYLTAAAMNLKRVAVMAA